VYNILNNYYICPLFSEHNFYK